MDSSNSGSFQSSSGAAAGIATGDGDTQEYDSTTPSISSFFNPSNHFNHLLHHPPPPPPSTTTFFHPSSPSPFSHNPGSSWTGTLQDFTTTYPINPTPSTLNTNTDTTPHHHHHHQNHHHNQIGVTTKNPKKRTRASRRAPTTVLTTDTTNFRQMVQEFTGIPTSPFTTTTSLSRRLDLFRPTSQKLQPPVLNINHEFEKQSSASGLLDLQNPMLSFQSLLQTTSLVRQETNNDIMNKRWRGQSEKMETLGDDNVNININVMGDQVQGNNNNHQGSWVCPSN